MTATTRIPNVRETLARERKSFLMAVEIRKAVKPTPEVLAFLIEIPPGAEFWATVAQKAGCEPPHSVETVQEILKFLKSIEPQESTCSN